LRTKIDHMTTLEAELSKMQDIKPQLEQLTKTQEVLTAEKDELIREKSEQEEKSKVLEEKLSTVEKTKDEVFYHEDSKLGIASHSHGFQKSKSGRTFLWHPRACF